nr:hypothetical protein L203_05073 [Cryptococcus depauperatus CBS 7841]
MSASGRTNFTRASYANSKLPELRQPSQSDSSDMRHNDSLVSGRHKLISVPNMRVLSVGYCWFNGQIHISSFNEIRDVLNFWRIAFLLKHGLTPRGYLMERAAFGNSLSIPGENVGIAFWSLSNVSTP